MIWWFCGSQGATRCGWGRRVLSTASRGHFYPLIRGHNRSNNWFLVLLEFWVTHAEDHTWNSEISVKCNQRPGSTLSIPLLLANSFWFSGPHLSVSEWTDLRGTEFILFVTKALVDPPLLPYRGDSLWWAWGGCSFAFLRWVYLLTTLPSVIVFGNL